MTATITSVGVPGAGPRGREKMKRDWWAYQNAIKDADGSLIGTTSTENGVGEATEKATLIVKAVNEYEALVTALAWALPLAQVALAQNERLFSMIGRHSADEEMSNEARRALSKALGRDVA